MKPPSITAPGLRLAMTAGVAVLALALGTSWIEARDATSKTGTIQHLAQAPTAPKPAAQDGDFTAGQKAAIGKIIKDYLLANPEIMLEVQTALDARMEKLQAEKLKIALQSNASEIYRSKAPVAGNPAGDIPVVEFFDYNCGYCKRAFSDIAKLVEQDNKVKLVLKELPILSKGSEEASRVALAAGLQGKYWPVHRALISLRGPANAATALKAAEKVDGIDMAKLKKDMTSEEVNSEIRRVRDLAQKMGIQGTPHFLVGDRAIAGAPTDLLQQIQTHVTELRKSGGCPVC
ncbi:MAG: DsbA family protein [Hyphomicrobiaceae bacterium]